MKYNAGRLTEKSLRILLLAAVLAALTPLSIHRNSVISAQTESSADLDAPNFVMVSASPNAVELGWTEVSGADRYELRAWWEGADGWQRIDDGDLKDTSFVHESVTVGRKYHYIVAALDSDGKRGAWSEQPYVIVPDSSETLTAPTLMATSTLTTTIDLSWNAVSGAVRYDLRVWWEGLTDWQPLDDGNLTGTSYPHSGLTPGRKYHYIIRAVDAEGEFSSWTQLEHQLSQPGSDELTATPTSTPTLLLTATSTLTPAASATPTATETPEFTATVTATAAVTATVTVTPTVTPTATPTVTPTATPTVTPTATSTASALSAPTLIAEAGAGLITLTWEAVTNAVSYQLLVWDSEARNWRRLVEEDLTDTSYTHRGLTAGTTNYYAVRAVGADGALSEWSNRPSATVRESSDIQVEPEERAALVALYEATEGANWERSNNWLSDEPVGSWYGVSTDGSGRVERINLQGNGLRGQLPDLGALTSLTNLSLGNNELSGPIPDLSALANLRRVRFSYNKLSGPIQNLDALPYLTHLSLNDNELSGSIPDLSVLPNLTWLEFSRNKLSGTIPDLGALTNLTFLYLGANELSGPIPDLSALTNLRLLSFGNNQLSGPIPNMSTLTNLRRLYLGANQLSGSIPDLSALTELEVLSLAKNQLTGPIPDLSALSNLIWMDLESNQLSGSIPDLDALTNLTTLELNDNRLSGSVPDLGALASLTWLNLSSNQLSGSVPDLSALSNLENLYLESNELTGSIPDLSALTNLTWLNLASNQLTGPVPELSALSNLENLYLESNELTGVNP